MGKWSTRVHRVCAMWQDGWVWSELGSANRYLVENSQLDKGERDQLPCIVKGSKAGQNMF